MGFCKKCDVDLVLTLQDRLVCPNCGQDVCSLDEFRKMAIDTAWADLKDSFQTMTAGALRCLYAVSVCDETKAVNGWVN